MKFGSFFSGWVGGLIGALAVVAIAIAAWVLLAPPPVEESAPPAPLAGLPQADAPGDPAAQVAPEAPAMAAPETPAAPAAPAMPDEPAALAPVPPAFDVVRIKPDGDALVAGRAMPGAEVSVLVDGTSVAATKADGGAGFVAMFQLPPVETDRVMTLEAVLEDGTRLVSEMNVIVEGVALPAVVAMAETPAEPAPAPDMPAPAAVPQPETPPMADVVAVTPPGTEDAPAAAPVAADAPAPAAPAADAAAQEAAPDVAASAPELAAPAAPGQPTAPAPVPVPVSEPEAPRILLAGPDGLRVLQDPSPRPQLSIDAIAYDEAGEVALSGRGEGAQLLRIYLDNAPVGTAKIDAGGDWHAPLPDLDAGVYTLRVDAVSPEGAVTSRVETPFKREDQAVLAAAGEQAAQAVAAGQRLSAITVQPGNTLWAIAEGRYGEGLQYWAIFDANRDQIRDPDWIYPGQVFTLPDAAN